MFKLIYIMQQRPKNIYWNYLFHLLFGLAIIIFAIDMVKDTIEFQQFKNMSHDEAMLNHFAKTDFYYKLDIDSEDLSMYIDSHNSLYIISKYKIVYEEGDHFQRTLSRKPLKHINAYRKKSTGFINLKLFDGDQLYEEFNFILDELERSDEIENTFKGLDAIGLGLNLPFFIIYTVLFIYVRKRRKYNTHELIK